MSVVDEKTCTIGTDGTTCLNNNENYTVVIYFSICFILIFYYLNYKMKIISDLIFFKRFGDALLQVSNSKNKHPTKKRTLVNCFNDAVRKWGKKQAVYFVDEKRGYTYNELNEKSNQYAHFLLQNGIKQGDVVGLLMPNTPEYIITELAVAKLGCVSALLNYNQKDKTLIHSLETAECDMLIFSSVLIENVKDIKDRVQIPNDKNLQFVCQDDEIKDTNFTCKCIEKESLLLSKENIDASYSASVSPNDMAFLVFTSGTTGLPKAAIVMHKRVFFTSVGFANTYLLKHDDRIYTTLPLYHSSGGMLGLGWMLNKGCTLILRSKFSARAFWKDIAENKATVTQYIGELCRYLMSLPESENDKNHTLRIAIGNGLRPDIWKNFTDRFHIAEIGEFYGSTEGNIGFFNHWYQGEPVGAIGQAGYLRKIFQEWRLVKFDVVNEETVRDSNGFCIEASKGEPGELLAKIKADSASLQFSGYYKNKEATEKKIMRDVFQKGDIWCRAGDLLKHENGYLYFVDRIGDTFRWKGENVSTTEVAEVVSSIDFIDEVNIVGVALPGKDGRACLAAVTFKEDMKIDLNQFYEICKTSLPSYAIPLFIRVLPHVEMTGTFKLMKVAYKNEGINPDTVKGNDPFYWFNSTSKTYESLDRDIYDKIANGKVKI